MSPTNYSRSSKIDRSDKHQQRVGFCGNKCTKKRTTTNSRMVVVAPKNPLLPPQQWYKMMGGFGNNNNNNDGADRGTRQRQTGSGNTTSPLIAETEPPNDDFLLGLDQPPYLMSQTATDLQQSSTQTTYGTTESLGYRTTSSRELHSTHSDRRVSSGPTERFASAASPDILGFGESCAPNRVFFTGTFSKSDSASLAAKLA